MGALFVEFLRRRADGARFARPRGEACPGKRTPGGRRPGVHDGRGVRAGRPRRGRRRVDGLDGRGALEHGRVARARVLEQRREHDLRLARSRPLHADAGRAPGHLPRAAGDEPGAARADAERDGERARREIRGCHRAGEPDPHAPQRRPRPEAAVDDGDHLPQGALRRAFREPPVPMGVGNEDTGTGTAARTNDSGHGAARRLATRSPTRSSTPSLALDRNLPARERATPRPARAWPARLQIVGGDFNENAGADVGPTAVPPSWRARRLRQRAEPASPSPSTTPAAATRTASGEARASTTLRPARRRLKVKTAGYGSRGRRSEPRGAAMTAASPSNTVKRDGFMTSGRLSPRALRDFRLLSAAASPPSVLARRVRQSTRVTPQRLVRDVRHCLSSDAAACGRTRRPHSDAATDVGDADWERPTDLVDATPPASATQGARRARRATQATRRTPSLPADAEAERRRRPPWARGRRSPRRRPPAPRSRTTPARRLVVA